MRSFTRAILRKPAKSFVNAIAQTYDHQKPSYKKALAEHVLYANTLKKMGLTIFVCEADERFPDGNFVEDTHLILGKDIIIELNPGALSRANEPMSLSSQLPNDLPRHVLSKHYTIDGGDILEDGKSLYVGLSKRTQQGAIDELAAIVAPFGYHVHGLKVPYGLHLKSGMTCMLPKHFIIQAGFIDILKELQINDPTINFFVVPEDEHFAANILPINGKIMIPSNCPVTKKYIAKYYDHDDIYEVDTAQVQLVDGALTCGCLLFA